MLKRVQHDSKIHDVTLNLFQGLSNFKTTQKNKQVAFSLAEVLITLVIIGIISAITVPIAINNHKWAQYKTGAQKAMSTLNNAVTMFATKEGYIPQCGEWKKIPYGQKVCLPENTNADGSCNKQTLQDGSDVPNDYYGLTTDCVILLKFLTKNLNVLKYCAKEAYLNGCSPLYEGLENVYERKNPGKTEDEVKVATNSVRNFMTGSMKVKGAIVTTDGMIFLPQTNYTPITFAVDINGKKGPNKWGHDLIVLRLYTKSRYDIPQYIPNKSNNFVDVRGKTTNELLYGK